MLDLDLEFDDRSFRLIRAAPDQARFACARALTRTATDAQKEVRAEIPRRFRLRRRWIVQGIRTERATKNELVAKVVSRDWFMKFQEEGGTRRPQASKRMVVPVDDRTRARRLKNRKQNRADDRAGAMGYKGAFYVRFKDGHEAIAKRRGKKRFPLVILYHLEPKVETPARFEMTDTVRETAYRRFNENFRFAMDQAVRTARPR